jgi:hypothetical protein
MGRFAERQARVTRIEAATARSAITPALAGVGVRAFRVSLDADDFYLDLGLTGVLEVLQGGEVLARAEISGGRPRPQNDDGSFKAHPGVRVSVAGDGDLVARVTWNKPTRFAVEYEALQGPRPQLDAHRSISQAQAVTLAQGAGVDSLAVTYGASTTSGNLFVLSVWCYVNGNGALGTGIVSDNKSNTWTRRVAGGLQGTTEDAAIYDCANGSGGAGHQVTCNPAGTGNYLSIQAWELTGEDGTNPIGGTAGANGLSTAPATGNLSAAAASGDFQVAVCCFAGAVGTVSITVGSFTPAYTEVDEELDDTNQEPGEADYRIHTGATSGGCSWTLPESVRWSCCTANYVAAAGGGGADAVPQAWAQFRARRS